MAFTNSVEGKEIVNHLFHEFFVNYKHKIVSFFSVRVISKTKEHILICAFCVFMSEPLYHIQLFL